MSNNGRLRSSRSLAHQKSDLSISNRKPEEIDYLVDLKIPGDLLSSLKNEELLEIKRRPSKRRGSLVKRKRASTFMNFGKKKNRDSLSTIANDDNEA
jgi:hypothetical protein